MKREIILTVLELPHRISAMARIYYFLFAAMLLLSACSAKRAGSTTDSTVAPPSLDGSFPKALPTLSFFEPPTPTVALFTPTGEETRTGFNVRGWT